MKLYWRANTKRFMYKCDYKEQVLICIGKSFTNSSNSWIPCHFYYCSSFKAKKHIPEGIMAMGKSGLCEVCSPQDGQIIEGKYRCPTCGIRFCSVPCSKDHKASGRCVKPEPSPPPPLPDFMLDTQPVDARKQKVTKLYPLFYLFILSASNAWCL